MISFASDVALSIVQGVDAELRNPLCQAQRTGNACEYGCTIDVRDYELDQFGVVSSCICPFGIFSIFFCLSQND